MALHPFEVSADAQADWYRNIVTLRQSVDLLKRFVDSDVELAIVRELEAATKLTSAPVPIINRPFEDATVYDPIAAAIRWPFEHPCRSRFSDGSFGVWYGAGTLETSVRETVWHFRINTLASAAAAGSTEPIYQERRVHLVHCDALLIDLRSRCASEPQLIDPDDYGYCQAVGGQLRAASQPGVLNRSARHEAGTVAAVFTAEALSDPRDVCYFTYALDAQSGDVRVERKLGKAEWVMRDLSHKQT